MARADLAAALIGVACVAGGGVLWSLALQAQRAAAPPDPAAGDGAGPSRVAAAATPAEAPAPCPTTAGLVPAPAASAPAAPAPGGALGVRFVRGDALPRSEDRARLVEVAARLARYDHVKVSLESFADAPGDRRGLAKQRGAAVKAILVERGVDLERIETAVGNVATSPDGAGLVLVRTNPPLPEGDGKAP
jgi:outer membrane protein OmpA-like peptidoglycan-associated protein